MSITTVLVTNSVSNAYVSGGNTAITSLVINNFTSNTVTANLHAVPAGGSANTQNLILTNIEMTGFEAYQLYLAAEKLLLGNNDSIQAVANSTGNLNIVTSYTTV
jgi:hypothetical protein